MDDKAAFGYMQGLGKTLAAMPSRDAAAELRALESSSALSHYLRGLSLGPLATRLDEFLSTAATDTSWLKTRAQLLLAVKLARGEVKDAGPQHGKRGPVRPSS
ncbi:MAG: hypothetical protein ACYDCK_02420 [Thermoplasmatota archaeon]